MQAITKKEVSCKMLDPIFYYAQQNNVDLNNLITGTPYELVYLLNKRERIEWSVWCKIISNAKVYFSPSEFVEMGSQFVNSRSYKVGLLPVFFLFSSSKLSRFLAREIFKLIFTMFNCVRQQIEFVSLNKVKIIVTINEGYEFCPEFFYISKGYWGGLGAKIGHKHFNFDMHIIGSKGVYEATWDKEDYFFKVRRGLRWLSNIRKALLEMTDAHEELLHQYEKLEISERTLQTQTAQLKTAYDIATSIWQRLDIHETLKTITNVLVKETGFLMASIELSKDVDSKDIDIKVQSGSASVSVSPIRQEIIVKDKKIGELILYPKMEMDYFLGKQLLEYLTPVITIAIHDALLLRAVTDYKDNLEQKVSDRTLALQKAWDDLTEKNKLLKEVQKAQNRFFTNISHEFRTSLTLILGPSKQLSIGSKEEKTKSTADLIHRSAKKINKLVEELLDLSKIEAGEMKLKASPQNLVALTKEVSNSFYSFAERKKIRLTLNSELSEIIVYVDKEKLDKILTNVLSNAFKFTPEGGRVNITIKKDKKFSEIAVADSGTGIPKNELDKIFDRFYQVDGSPTREYEGTGIGLSLTKELIELHKGEIKVESEEGKGSIFHLFFPLGKEHLKPEEIFELQVTEKKGERILKSEEFIESTIKQKADFDQTTETEKPVLLIVEDDADLRNYIISILGDGYKIKEANDGEEGLYNSFEHIPDLIITDIMMPKLDGLQLCGKLKTDFRTSHIPIIMLTAKATMKDKITGLEFGADDYIMKPFEVEELKARIKNLIEQRGRLHEHFRKFGYFQKVDQKITSVDETFIQNAVIVINEHLSDTTFGIEQLAEKLAVSRALLFKKMNHLIGEPPGEMTKRIRLNKAAQLIEKNVGNISEIALEVGFNNPSYFSECFKRQFGFLPSQYHQNKHFS